MRILLVEDDIQLGESLEAALKLEQYADLVNYITQVFARQVDAGLPVSEPWLRQNFEQDHVHPLIIDGSVTGNMSPALNIWLDDQLLAALESSPRFSRPEAEGFSYVHLEGSAMLDRIALRVDRASHTVGQLLTLARVDPETPLPETPWRLSESMRTSDSRH